MMNKVTCIPPKLGRYRIRTLPRGGMYQEIHSPNLRRPEKWGWISQYIPPLGSVQTHLISDISNQMLRIALDHSNGHFFSAMEWLMVNRIPRLVFIKITGYDAGSMIKLSENKRIHRAQCVHMTHYFQSTVRGLATLFQPFSASAHTVSSMRGHALLHMF